MASDVLSVRGSFGCHSIYWPDSLTQIMQQWLNKRKKSNIAR